MVFFALLLSLLLSLIAVILVPVELWLLLSLSMVLALHLLRCVNVINVVGVVVDALENKNCIERSVHWKVLVINASAKEKVIANGCRLHIASGINCLHRMHAPFTVIFLNFTECGKSQFFPFLCALSAIFLDRASARIQYTIRFVYTCTGRTERKTLTATALIVIAWLE